MAKHKNVSESRKKRQIEKKMKKKLRKKFSSMGTTWQELDNLYRECKSSTKPFQVLFKEIFKHNLQEKLSGVELYVYRCYLSLLSRDLALFSKELEDIRSMHKDKSGILDFDYIYDSLEISGKYQEWMNLFGGTMEPIREHLKDILLYALQREEESIKQDDSPTAGQDDATTESKEESDVTTTENQDSSITVDQDTDTTTEDNESVVSSDTTVDTTDEVVELYPVDAGDDSSSDITVDFKGVNGSTVDASSANEETKGE